MIAATNKKLEEEIGRNAFREDLFYRLNVIPFYVPALRERTEDIPILAAHFLEAFCAEYGKKPKEFSRAAMDVLLSLSVARECARAEKSGRAAGDHVPFAEHRAAPFAAGAFSRRGEEPAEAVREPAGGAVGVRTGIRAAQAGRKSLEHDQSRGRRWAWSAATCTARCARWESRPEVLTKRGRASEQETFYTRVSREQSGVCSPAVRTFILSFGVFGLDRLLRFGQLFELAVPIQLANDCGFWRQLRLHFHEQFQKDARAENRFDFLARLRADFLHGLAALADENSLLPFALDVERRANPDQIRLPSSKAIHQARRWRTGTSSRVARIAFSRMISAARKRSGWSVNWSAGK